MMTKYQKRRDTVDGIVDRIIDVYECERFSEFTCKVGGDVVVYRAYGDGELITQR